MQIIFAYGDSITWGASDDEMGGWANRLRLYLEKNVKTEADDVRFYTLGIPGETTEGLKARFKNETEARLREGWENVFIFAFGANDLAYLPAKERFAVPIEGFEKNLREVIGEAKKYSSKIMLLNIIPIVEEITKAPKDNKKIRFDECVENYNRKIEEIVKEENVPLADVHSAILAHGGDTLFIEDGVHPTSEGHRVMFEAVKDVLGKIL